MEEVKAKTEGTPSPVKIQTEKELRIGSQRLKEGLTRSLVRTTRMLKEKGGRERIIQDPVGCLSEVTGIKDQEFLEQLFEGTKAWVEETFGVTPEGELLELPETTAQFGLFLLPLIGDIKAKWRDINARWEQFKRRPFGKTREEVTRRGILFTFIVSAFLGALKGLDYYTPELARRPGGLGVDIHLRRVPIEEAEEQDLNQLIAGDLYKDYMSGRMFISPFKIESPRVRALVGFTVYGKGIWFSDRLKEKNKGLLEGVMGRKFTDEELRKWRENPELFLSHLEQMHEEGKVSQEVLDFYKKPRSQIREEYLADYPPLPKGE